MRYQRNDAQIVDGYPHAFGPDDFRALEAFLGTFDAVIPLAEVEAGNRSTDYCSMRHDVDHNLEHALKFARWEQARGFRSTYFVLHSAWYWHDVAALEAGVCELAALGHEVGIHSNAVGLARDYGDDPGHARAATILADAIAQLNIILEPVDAHVVGSAAHGDTRCTTYSVHNNDLFTDGGGAFDLDYFGLKYEAYFLHRDAWYISDSGGRLTPPAPLAKDPNGKRTTMLLHPCHWDLDTELGAP